MKAGKMYFFMKEGFLLPAIYNGNACRIKLFSLFSNKIFKNGDYQMLTNTNLYKEHIKSMHGVEHFVIPAHFCPMYFCYNSS